MPSCVSTLITRRWIGCAIRVSRRIGLNGGRSRRRAGLGRPPRDRGREAPAARALPHVLRQLAEPLQRRPPRGVLPREVVPPRARGAGPLGERGHGAPRARAIIEPAPPG